MTAPIAYRRRGQAVWLDSISNKMIRTGRLKSLIDAGTIYGVTSNPTIFGKAIEANEGEYNAALERLAREGKDAFAIYDALTQADIAERRRRVSRDPRPRSRGRLDLPRGAPVPRAGDGEDRRRGETPFVGSRPAERVHQSARDAGRRPRDPAAHRGRRVRERDAHVQPPALPRRRAGVHRRPPGSRGAGRGPFARPLRRVFLRLPRRHARRQAAGGEGRGGLRRREGAAARPSREGGPREQQGRLPGLPRGLRRRAVPLAPREGRRASRGRCGPRRARRTRPTPTSCTSRTSSGPTP